MWDVIIYPSNYFPHETMDTINYPCNNLITLCEKEWPMPLAPIIKL